MPIWVTMLMSVMANMASVVASGAVGGKQDQEHAGFALTILNALSGIHPSVSQNSSTNVILPTTTPPASPAVVQEAATPGFVPAATGSPAKPA